jgi:hypothetical protein
MANQCAKVAISARIHPFHRCVKARAISTKALKGVLIYSMWSTVAWDSQRLKTRITNPPGRSGSVNSGICVVELRSVKYVRKCEIPEMIVV